MIIIVINARPNHTDPIIICNLQQQLTLSSMHVRINFTRTIIDKRFLLILQIIHSLLKSQSVLFLRLDKGVVVLAGVDYSNLCSWIFLLLVFVTHESRQLTFHFLQTTLIISYHLYFTLTIGFPCILFYSNNISLASHHDIFGFILVVLYFAWLVILLLKLPEVRFAAEVKQQDQMPNGTVVVLVLSD